LTASVQVNLATWRLAVPVFGGSVSRMNGAALKALHVTMHDVFSARSSEYLN
jgi:hypothetical protein